MLLRKEITMQYRISDDLKNLAEAIINRNASLGVEMTPEQAKSHLEQLVPAFLQDVLFQELFTVCYSIKFCEIKLSQKN